MVFAILEAQSMKKVLEVGAIVNQRAIPSRMNHGGMAL
jgi:hypothetical protein